MKTYIKAHEDYILTAIQGKAIDSHLLDYHHLQIQHLQHERLIHLLVMIFVGLLAFTSLILLMIELSLAIGLLCLILFTLEAFYIRHYYLLENTVQRWYLFENTLYHQLKGVGSNLY